MRQRQAVTKAVATRYRSHTKPGSLLEDAIPTQTWAQWDDAVPGFVGDRGAAGHHQHHAVPAAGSPRELTFAVPCAAKCVPADIRDRAFGSAGVGFQLLWYVTRGRFDRLQRQAFGHA